MLSEFGNVKFQELEVLPCRKTGLSGLVLCLSNMYRQFGQTFLAVWGQDGGGEPRTRNKFEHKFHKPRPSSVQFCQMDRINDLSKVILHWHLCGPLFDSEETSWQGSRAVLRKAHEKYETPGNWQHFDDVKQTKRNQTTEGKLRN